MTWLLVPRDASSSSAEIWIGAIDEPAPGAGIALRVGPDLIAVDSQRFETWPVAAPQLRWQRVTVSNLPAAARIGAGLEIGGQRVASAVVTTLPSSASRSRPLRLLLASCFAHRSDKLGRVGSAFSRLPAPKPDLKILCGDQVYLDSPYWAYLKGWEPPALRQRIFNHYRDTWTQREGELGGFLNLLREGSNWFLSDDHELWNNAPNPSFAVDSWSEPGRTAWLSAAKPLYDAFQTATPRGDGKRIRFSSLAGIDFCFAETRMNREADRSRFMNEGELGDLVRWIASRTAPAVLVLGQPLFAEPAGFIGRFSDWKLQDYSQFERLAQAVKNAPHSLVVLSGDVHFGRIAIGKPKNGVEIVEIISSPLALVESPLPRSGAESAPDRLPDAAFPIDTLGDTRIGKKDHFAMIELAPVGASLELKVEAWEIRDGPPQRLYANPFTRSLH